jgi:hypothetical protein
MQKANCHEVETGEGGWEPVVPLPFVAPLRLVNAVKSEFSVRVNIFVLNIFMDSAYIKD